jgi:hypothetical protein
MSDESGTDERIKRPPIPQSVEPAAPVPPTAAQKRYMRAAKRQIAAEAAPTELRVGHDQWQHPIVGLPHTDAEGWYAQARIAFGTVSTPFVEAEIERLLNALRWRRSTLPLETELNCSVGSDRRAETAERGRGHDGGSDGSDPCCHG